MAQQDSHIKRVRTIADYQFGKGAGATLFPDNVDFKFSTTRRIRQIILDNNRLATVRAQDGMLTLSMAGARRLHECTEYPAQRVVVNKDAAPFVAKGKNAFAKHVVNVDPGIRAGQEILIVDENDNLLATGKAVLCALEMLSFKKGMAVNVRSGIGTADRPDEEETTCHL